MPFASDIKQWKNSTELSTYLKNYDPAICKWVKGTVLHHTVNPLVSSWKGEPTMKAMQRYYESMQWTAGPHLFVVAGSPNPANDGIWQMTPLDAVGIHAGICNSHFWGLEVVGNYDATTWDAATTQLVLSTIVVLHNWASLQINDVTIIGHRDCKSPKTCPGRAINLASVRTALLDMRSIYAH